MASQERALSITEVLDAIEEAGHSGKVKLGDIIDSFGRRSYGPVLLVPALVAILPVVGALPGVSMATAGICLVIAIQLLLDQHGPRLPSQLRKLAMPRKALNMGVRWIRPVANWIDPLVKFERLGVLTNGLFKRAVGALAVVIALAMCVGALLPGTIVPPALAMIVLALGLTSKDGLLVLISAALASGSVALLVWVFAF